MPHICSDVEISIPCSQIDLKSNARLCGDTSEARGYMVASVFEESTTAVTQAARLE